MTYICLKIKYSFPELNPNSTKMQNLEGDSGGIQITSLPLGEKLTVFPLDHFARCTAISVLLTSLSTYEVLGAPEVPAVIIFLKT